MGKKRITQLLNQLDAIHQADVQNTTAIYTVAQVAVNQLGQPIAQAQVPEPATLAPASVSFTQAALKQQYGSFNACRKAAKAKGIRFRSTPSWEKLATAFSYFETLQTLIQAQVKTNPQPNLSGVSMAFELD